MNKTFKFWQNYKEQILLGVVSFLLVAGVAQQAIGWTYVLKLTAIMITVITALMIIFWGVPPRKKVLLSVIVIAIGFIVEVIGVNTGLLFGDYTYGSLLSFKIFGVPIIIGVTWLLVTMSAWQIAMYDKSLNLYKRLALASFLVVMFDLVLEQFAITYSLWQWAGNFVPIFNYITWLVVSLVIFAIYHKVSPKWEPSIFVAGVLPILAIFFWLMLLIS